ncbi:beta-ketothiolase BktB [Brevundimonas goettingensis]|uniref:Beta-ketothiolase BktB n=1 Tax=Brevundimonas goettingensis TaxID=2774190 RepID=A0A975BZD9_9CAUL|nr:beta-ketothiolase BktB [Brevundimonas goettingensis]QTC89897.1 beta-ketothiolase BktB [Brevundimonas goettingensis]
MTEPVFIVAARRTAIGGFGGSLKDKTPGELGALVTRSALETGGVDLSSVGHVVFGQVIPTAPRDAYLARVATIEAGLSQDVPAMTVNRLCGSGLQAVVSAAQMIMLGDAEVTVAGGSEVMSRAPYFAPAARWGQKMGDALLVDGLNGALTDPFGGGLMGVTAENVAERHGVDRARQDAYAVESHRRAAQAIAERRFASQILPVEVKAGRATKMFEVDEHVRADATVQDLAKLRTIFRDGGTVTAGNASGINDAAAALVLAGESAVARQGLKPMARIVAYGHAGVDPDIMGMGPVPATRAALARAGLSVADMDVIESNEAFAAQACAVSDQLGFDPAKVNPNGSGISLGHPVGATGAIIATKLVHELERGQGRYGLATMCIGGGQGMALIVERV